MSTFGIAPQEGWRGAIPNAGKLDFFVLPQRYTINIVELIQKEKAINSNGEYAGHLSMTPVSFIHPGMITIYVYTSVNPRNEPILNDLTRVQLIIFIGKFTFQNKVHFKLIPI